MHLLGKPDPLWVFPSVFVVFKQFRFTCAWRRTQVLCSEVRAVASPISFCTCKIVSCGVSHVVASYFEKSQIPGSWPAQPVQVKAKTWGQNVAPGDAQAGLLPFSCWHRTCCWECCCFGGREVGASSARKSQSCAGGCWKPSPVPLFQEE